MQLIKVRDKVSQSISKKKTVLKRRTTRNGVNPHHTSHTGNFHSPGGDTDTVTHTDGVKLNARSNTLACCMPAGDYFLHKSTE